MQWQYYDFMGTIMIIFHKKEVISVREHHKNENGFENVIAGI